MPSTHPASTNRAVWLVLAGILSVQVGASFSKLLFGQVTPTALVWVRLAFSALLLVVIARPRLAGRSGMDWLVVLGFGAAVATMNWSIYQSFSRMPLGAAVTIEFLGPLLVALAHSKHALDLLWVLLAGAGVTLLGLHGAGVTAAGVLFALLAGAGWGAYILLTAETGKRWPGLSGLAAASVVGALLLAPAAIASDGAALTAPLVLGVGALVGLMSSVLPYSFEMVALRTMSPRVFGILMSLEPAAAALVGVVLLGEWLGPFEWLAVGCVVVASIGVTRTTPADALPTD